MCGLTPESQPAIVARAFIQDAESEDMMSQKTAGELLRETARGLAEFLHAQDQKRGDLSYRAEGLFQAITALARSGYRESRDELRAGIIAACKAFNQMEARVEWPSNRFAVEALKALGFSEPGTARA